MTQRLFDIDSYKQDFTAKCLSAEEIKNEQNQTVYKLALDATCFFPEGGGQKSDKGTLNGIPVFDVQEENGVIYHFTASPISVGDTVNGKIDWNERFYKMQNHTAEHIVSGIIHKKFGFDNVGFHLGEDFITMDYNGEISQSQLLEIEEEANEAVWANLPVTAWYPENPKEFSYRSKLDLTENVRLVKIENVDLCACCAPHVAFTGEIGYILILSCQRFRQGVRITAKCGRFALDEIQKQQQVLKNASHLLSLPYLEIDSGIEKLKASLDEARFDAVGAQKKLLTFEIENSSCPFVFVDEPSLLKDGANLLFDKFSSFVCAFCGNDKDGYRFMALFPENQKNKCEVFKKELSASGGGGNNMLQGIAKSTKEQLLAFAKGFL
ncbi:MAG: alanyl-tRNA editing protein [Clostridia bacterium]|nr:alanyl-tRNA editing protein [Clostridia bacterium]